MPIRPFTVYPQSTDPPESFAPNGDSWIKEVSTQFIPDANALEANVNAKEVSATQQAEISAQQAEIAGGYADMAATQAAAAGQAAAYKGVWSSLSGSLDIPASVYHNDEFWALISNIPDVTLKEPGVDPVWKASTGTFKAISKTADFTFEAHELDGFKTINNSGSTGDIVGTLPAGANGDIFEICIVESHYLRLNANGTEEFNYFGTKSGSENNYIRSNSPGAYIRAIFIAGEWRITTPAILQIKIGE